MTECRWSGWPGAWCLDCGRDDPREIWLADGGGYSCKLDPNCECKNADQWLKCINFGPIDEPKFDLTCSEPGSNKHNPYVAKGIGST